MNELVGRWLALRVSGRCAGVIGFVFGDYDDEDEGCGWYGERRWNYWVHHGRRLAPESDKVEEQKW